MPIDSDKMESHPHIRTTWFYIDDDEKTKLNWLVYEYACELYGVILKSRKKSLKAWKAARSDEQIADYCAYYAKRMRRSLIKMLEGRSRTIDALGAFVTDYVHSTTYEVSDELTELGGVAWNQLMAICAACPQRCMPEANRLSSFFDRAD